MLFIIKEYIVSYFKNINTRNELHDLDDRLLQDIGINRYDIDHIDFHRVNYLNQNNNSMKLNQVAYR